MKATTILAFLFLICAAFPLYAADINDLTYDASGATVTITDCDTAASGALIIPETIEGKPVTSIGEDAFKDCSGLTSNTLPDWMVVTHPVAIAAGPSVVEMIV